MGRRRRGRGNVAKRVPWPHCTRFAGVEPLAGPTTRGPAMPLLVKNGRIITATDDYKADIYCADETITRIEKAIDAKKLPKSTEVVNAGGKLVFPGFIDPHVHIYLP